MGRIKELQDECYKSIHSQDAENVMPEFVHPTFIGLIEIVKKFTAQNDSEFNFEMDEAFRNEIKIDESENVDPNQLRLFSAEAV